MSLPATDDRWWESGRPWWGRGFDRWARGYWSRHGAVPAKAAHKRRFGR